MRTAQTRRQQERRFPYREYSSQSTSMRAPPAPSRWRKTDVAWRTGADVGHEHIIDGVDPADVAARVLRLHGQMVERLFWSDKHHNGPDPGLGAESTGPRTPGHSRRPRFRSAPGRSWPSFVVVFLAGAALTARPPEKLLDVPAT